jgi:hypothetical protein
MNHFRPTAAQLVAVGLLVLLSACAAPRDVVPTNPLGVRILQTNDVLRVELNGKLFTNIITPTCPARFAIP